ncbi:MAG: PD-(D/E)XK nuclease family protein [Thermoleophilia bacterium]|nr:PD-(D/E)XK nuclease family protein [Thermoleophilia bacterium]
MPLALLVGPANAGKVASLLDRYVAALDRDPFLVVPDRGEVERIERELLTRVPVLLGGSIGTFDDLVERIVRSAPHRPLLGRAQRALLLGELAARAGAGPLSRSCRFRGFADALGDAIAVLAGGRVDPDEVDGGLGRLYGAYRDELDRLGVWDEELRLASAAGLAAGDLAAWDGAPVLVYGFEDLSGARWALLEALAGRGEVCVALPYEPGRPAFEALERVAGDLAGLAGDGIAELPARSWYDGPALAYLERELFEDGAPEPPPLDGAIGFLEGSGTRAALELVGGEILALLGTGAPADGIAVVVPSIERVRAPLETVFSALGIPYAVDGPLRLGRTALGRALLGVLRFAWLDGSRADLFAFLRSPYSGLSRNRSDFVEGRLRGRAISAPPRVEAEAVRLLGHPLPALDLLRGPGTPAETVRALCRALLQAAWSPEAPVVTESLELDLRVDEAVGALLDELESWAALGRRAGREELVAALEQVTVATRARDPGRVTVLDLLRARTRRFDVVFVLGLEEGVLPRRVSESPFLPDERLRALEELGRPRRRLVRADRVAFDRYLFYTACTRPWRRLYLVREAATDDGRPLEPSPFWDEVRSRFAAEDVERATRRRPLSRLTWELHLAPTARERLRAVAALAAEDEGAARSLARAGGWERQIERALTAFSRPTRLVAPAVTDRLGGLARFSATELERMLDCSSMWFVDRVVSPRRIDAEIDAKLRGLVAHAALHRFFDGLPRRFGSDTVDPARLEEAVEFLRECLDDAVRGQARGEFPEVALLELTGTLARDLEQFLRRDVELGLPLVPRRFEVSFGTDRAAAELQRGLDLGGFTVSGKIDRIDVDPFSARGIVQDYKSGAAHSAARIESDCRLQVPLYVLALRDLCGIEPLGGLYRSLSGEREARGLLRAEARDDLPGLAPRDYLDEDAFWGQVELAAGRAREAAARIRAGDVRHDPRWSDGCPSWCESWPMCRVARA